jgi:hypothetical protein
MAKKRRAARASKRLKSLLKLPTIVVKTLTMAGDGNSQELRTSEDII